MFRHIHLIDTSIASDNLGDEIIVEEARARINRLFPDAYISSSSGHDGLGPFGRVLAADADICLLLGTNALSPRDQRRRRFVWTVARRDISALAGKVVLFGVGANRDFERVSHRQRRLLKRLLSPCHMHSVRDELGKKIVEAVGRKAINTSCCTLWRYASNPLPVPERLRPRRVVFTLTKHKPDAADADMVEALRERYEEVFFWPQQPRDLPYLKSLPGGDDRVTIIPPNLAAYDALLAEAPIDVIGTRLHGGIRGLRHGRRILVIGIDNRAREIGAETGLPVLPRVEVATCLSRMIASGWDGVPRLDPGPIRRFLSQFEG